MERQEDKQEELTVDAQPSQKSKNSEYLYENRLKRIFDNIKKSDSSKLRFRSGLPLARIKRIMKIDKSIRISSETSIIFAKACELFIIELSCKSYANSLLYKRRTIQKCDVKYSISSTEYLDFLLDQIDEKCNSSIQRYAQAFYSNDLNHGSFLSSLKFPDLSALLPKETSMTSQSGHNIEIDTEKENQIFASFIKHYAKFEKKI